MIFATIWARFWRLFESQSARRQRQRRIFRYFDGQRESSADPLAAWIALAEDAEFEIEKHTAAIDAGDSEAYKVVSRAVRRVFNVKPFADGGLTDQECLDLLLAFLGYMGSLKKSTNDSLTSSLPTESVSQPEPATAAAATATTAN
jgi:hypothetical protein